MKHFFTDGEILVIQLSKKLTRIAVVASASFMVIIACEPNHSSTDETQIQVSSGNEKLQRMEQIETELRAAGVSIKQPRLSIYAISNKPEAQLVKWRNIVHEYIEHAEAIIKIADRPDIAFGEKQKISDWLTEANNLLAIIEAEIGNLRHSANSANSFYQRCQ